MKTKILLIALTVTIIIIAAFGAAIVTEQKEIKEKFRENGISEKPIVFLGLANHYSNPKEVTICYQNSTPIDVKLEAAISIDKASKFDKSIETKNISVKNSKGLSCIRFETEVIPPNLMIATSVKLGNSDYIQQNIITKQGKTVTIE